MDITEDMTEFEKSVLSLATEKTASVDNPSGKIREYILSLKSQEIPFDAIKRYFAINFTKKGIKGFSVGNQYRIISELRNSDQIKTKDTPKGLYISVIR